MNRQVWWAVLWILVTMLFSMVFQTAVVADEHERVEMRFELRMQDRPAGTERAIFASTPEGLRAVRTESELRIGPSGGTMSTRLDWRPADGDAVSYELEASMGGRDQRLLMTREDGVVSFEGSVGGTGFGQDAEVEETLVVLDNMVAAHYASLLDWLDARQGEGGALSIAVPQPMKVLPARVQAEPVEAGLWEGEPVEVRVHTLQVANLVVYVRHAEAVPGRLLEVDVPIQSFRLRRAGYEEGGSRPAEMETDETPEGLMERELKIRSGEISLGATLTMPEDRSGRLPGLVLVHGSGPNDRDATVAKSKPFRDLAHGLARRGIAVLRYDKRSYAVRQGELDIPAQELDSLEAVVVDDAVAALETLHDIDGVDPGAVFVLGHSLGGLAVPYIAERAKLLRGAVVLAGPGRGLDELILDQSAYLMRRAGSGEEEIEARLSEIRRQVGRALDEQTGEAELVMGAPASFWRDVLARRPAAAAAGMKRPYLYLRGGKDYQVTAEDQSIWMAAAAEAGKENASFKVYPDLNHLFLEVEGESDGSDYQRGGQVSEKVVEDIAGWIERQSQRPVPSPEDRSRRRRLR